MSSVDSLTNIENRHDFDTSFTNEYDTNQTAVTILTPTSGKRLKIVGYSINSEASAGTVRLFFQTSNNTVGKTFAVTNPASGYVPVVIRGARNEPLKVTSDLGADQNYFLVVNYKEE